MIEEIVRFKTVASTQDTAKKFIHRHQEMAIVAQNQRRGRGRHGRQWSSPVGGLYVSLILFPEKRITMIPFLASLTVVRLLEQYTLSNIAIHWPNDILLKHNKVCGIICEQFGESIICGVGLNVNISDFPPHLCNVTSMFIESGRQYDLDVILTDLIDVFNPLYSKFRTDDLRVSDVMHYITGIGEAVEVITNSGGFTATICDINDDWSLLVRDKHGISRTLYYGEVRRLVW